SASHQEEHMDTLLSLSNELAGAVERAARAVVAVNARPRIASTGVHWRPGVVVTAEHTVRVEEDITVTAPDGRALAATLAGRAAGRCRRPGGGHQHIRPVATARAGHSSLHRRPRRGRTAGAGTCEPRVPRRRASSGSPAGRCALEARHAGGARADRRQPRA